MKRKKNWNITKLIATGGFAALGFLIFLPSLIIYSITGGNPFGAILGLFLGPLITVLTLLTINTFGAATLRNLMGTLISSPIPKVFPSFMIIPNSFITGIMSDILYSFLKKNGKFASLVIGGFDSFYYGIMIYILYRIVGFPGIEKIPAISWLLTPLGLLVGLTLVFLIGVAGGYLGYLIYTKIENTAVIKRIQR